MTQEQFDAMWASRFQTWQEEQQNYLADCRDVFGLTWKALDLAECADVIGDVLAEASETGATFRQAAVSVRNRIGGPQGLRRYLHTQRGIL